MVAVSVTGGKIGERLYYVLKSSSLFASSIAHSLIICFNWQVPTGEENTASLHSPSRRDGNHRPSFSHVTVYNLLDDQVKSASQTNVAVSPGEVPVELKAPFVNAVCGTPQSTVTKHIKQTKKHNLCYPCRFRLLSTNWPQEQPTTPTGAGTASTTGHWEDHTLHGQVLLGDSVFGNQKYLWLTLQSDLG